MRSIVVGAALLTFASPRSRGEVDVRTQRRRRVKGIPFAPMLSRAPPHPARTSGPHHPLPASGERKIAPRRARAHRATSQVVPFFVSFSTMPIAKSSSRIRSASLKFFVLRATARAAMRSFICEV